MYPFISIENATGPYLEDSIYPAKFRTPESPPVFARTLSPSLTSLFSKVLFGQPHPGRVDIKSFLYWLLYTQVKSDIS